MTESSSPAFSKTLEGLRDSGDEVRIEPATTMVLRLRQNLYSHSKILVNLDLVRLNSPLRSIPSHHGLELYRFAEGVAIISSTDVLGVSRA